ncbi:MAG: glutamine-hydrolyzing carbamoyl-phosphate synthase small subunit [Acidimicrobiia bacterium]
MKHRPALLVTSDGELFRGHSVGADGIRTGEAVFNTSMTGYLEVLTDPSYAGQVVVMTAPHIGNYGVTETDAQAGRPHVSGFVTRAMSRRDSNWRSEGSLGDYLVSNDVVAISGVDTRRLTRHIRDRGAMPIAMGSEATEGELREAAAAAPVMSGQDLAGKVSTREEYTVRSAGETQGTIVAIDLGIKRDILTNLTLRDFDVVVVPYSTPIARILDLKPDGLFVSNGPGDPEPLHVTTETIRGLIGKVPIFGICLGHQVLGRAIGADTFKLPFGHHGGNHPVRRMEDGKVEITSQNHGFAVDLWSLVDEDIPERDGLVGSELLPERVSTPYGEVLPTHQNLNDGTVEGMRLLDAPAYSVQYHPEAAPGPRDASPLFDGFVDAIHKGVT